MQGRSDAGATLTLSGDPGRQRKERIVHALFLAAAFVSVVISALIVISLFREAIAFLVQVDVGSLWADGWFPRRGMYDIKTLVVGTLLVTGIGMLVAGPVGLGAAVYLSEYASPRARRVLKPILEVLAGIPSVVMGFFALTWISPNLVQALWSQASLFNLAAAGIGVGVLTIPLVATIAEDAMHSVPNALREAAYGLGSRKRTTSVRVVFPAAVSGIVAAFIVGTSRAIGETMVVAIAAGGTGGSLFTVDITGPGQTMTAAMMAIATGSDQVKGAALTYESMFFVGALLFMMTFTLNLVSERFVRRVRRRY